VDAKASLAKSVGEQEELQRVLRLQEHELLKVPRLEEKYHKAARDLVRQKEVAMNQQEMRWKTLEEEVKTLGFWKSRAQALDDMMRVQNETIENLQHENRKLLSQSFKIRASANATVSTSASAAVETVAPAETQEGDDDDDDDEMIVMR